LKIGSNDELFRKIDQIAVYGFVIAAFGSAGSFIFAFLMEKLQESYSERSQKGSRMK